jgi:hypothetical protein
VRIFDYDVWTEDRLAPLQAIRWLSLFKELGPEELYKRYRDLDEEYQIALMAPFIELYDEDEYERLTQADQDATSRMPCGTVFYRIKTEDPRVHEFVASLMDSALDGDVAYAYSLLAHAAYMPPNEAEVQLAQFRRARLEEDGFVSFDESLGAFRPVDVEALRQRWDAGRVGGSALDRRPDAETGSLPFLVRVAERAARQLDAEQLGVIVTGLAHLGNSLCAAARVETDDLAGQARILEQAQALASLGLEYVSGGDVDTGVRIMAAEHARTLFQAGLALVARLQSATLRRLEDAGVPRAVELGKLWRSDRRGPALRLIDESLLPVLGFERAETLKGLLNRFPVRPDAVIAPDDESSDRAHGASSGAPTRMRFQPITSLAGLRSLAATLDGLAGLLRLAELAHHGGEDVAEPRLVDLDRQLLTALARVLAGGELRDRPLTPAELAKLTALPQPAAQAIAGDLFAAVEGSLRMALMPDGAAKGAAGWSVSRAADVLVDDPVQPVMAEFSDLVLRLEAARAELAARGGSLAHLIDVSPPSTGAAAAAPSDAT